MGLSYLILAVSMHEFFEKILLHEFHISYCHVELYLLVLLGEVVEVYSEVSSIKRHTIRSIGMVCDRC